MRWRWAAWGTAKIGANNKRTGVRGDSEKTDFMGGY